MPCTVTAAAGGGRTLGDPETCPYGEYEAHGLALVDAEVVEALATEIAAVEACGTVGEVRKLEPTLVLTWAPVDFEAADEDPYDWSEQVRFSA